MKTLRLAAGLIALGLAAAPAAAQSPYRPGDWAIRIGVADDPDQIVGGFHLSFDEVLDRLDLRPMFEVGFGDDVTVFSASLPVVFRPRVGGPVKPFVGLGVFLGVVEEERPSGRGRGGEDETDFEIAPLAVLGFEYPLGGDRGFLVELDLGGADAYDARLMFGVTF